MSRVKKAVLLVVVVFGLLLITMPANAKGSAKIGGTFINSESATITGSFDYQWEQGDWQQSFESDYQYKKNDNSDLSIMYLVLHNTITISLGKTAIEKC